MDTTVSRGMLCIGGLAAIAGAVCSGGGNLVHPVTPREDEAGVAAAIAAVVGTTVGLLTVILDGVAAKQLANRWSAATGADQAIALANVSTNETINFAVAGTRPSGQQASADQAPQWAAGQDPVRLLRGETLQPLQRRVRVERGMGREDYVGQVPQW